MSMYGYQPNTQSPSLKYDTHIHANRCFAYKTLKRNMSWSYRIDLVCWEEISLPKAISEAPININMIYYGGMAL